ncbi:2,' 3'-cyclic nucleotide 2'-phosphodiesterase [Paenibacillus macerans]|uniref:2,' 3'-cyclic nucleotide 2'-phosphodiesterase n=1 Tax=Paenibacillus macerans TaxID=44252 RepID=A0A6N8F5N7_PAEMA|nr:2,' 3'-cyclic nucleotide 2'-phosphodiesterase [Paenibacillus macerans]MEC0136114.1 2,' 3'-cyclic nucleotide 2'-phosphodiesterase [Paenibacillus macerans]MUG26500.1 2,' 3'-cyclic nucleotide 2'-phosphodiesterase [Paenibacillus macerans]
MKKWMYLLIGVVMGAVVTTTGSAFADQVKSMVGKQVAGEYNVNVNGNALAENAIVVEGKAHVPLRAVSDSLGANIVVNGKTIQITTNTADQTESAFVSEDKATSGKFANWPKDELEERKAKLEGYIINAEEGKEKTRINLERVEKSKDSSDFPKTLEITNKNIERMKQSIKESEAAIAEYKAELQEVNAALEALN